MARGRGETAGASNGVPSGKMPDTVASSIRPSAYRMRPVSDPPLRTRLCLATSSQRPATLTQQTTLELIRKLVE